jgi:predicted phosphodiesterase
VRIAIVSDVHGNRHAFDAVLQDADEGGCDELWCLGDLVGYGAEPDACVDRARVHAAVCLAGNHDLAVLGVLDLEEFSGGARTAAEWTQRVIGDRAIEYLRTLVPSCEDEAVGLYHASPRDPIWEYVLSPLQAEMCLDVQTHRVCLVGHTHVALSFWREEPGSATGQTRTDGEVIELGQGEWLLNPGSVGQPRDGDSRAAWLELDLDAWTATYRRTEYDVQAAAAAIHAARLPASLAERLSFGQ